MLAAQRRWKAFGAFIATATALTTLSIALVGFDAVPAYVRLLSSDLYVKGIAEPRNWNMLSLSAVAQSVAPSADRPVVMGCFFVAGLAGAWIINRTRHAEMLSPSDVMGRFAATILITALVDPHFFLYDCTVLLLPALIVLSQDRVTPGARVAIGAIYALTFLAPLIHRAALLPAPFNAIDTQWTVIPMASLLVTFCRSSTAVRLPEVVGLRALASRDGGKSPLPQR